MLLELPLELAAFGSRTNPYWLRKRKRSRWWSKGHYPKASPAECMQPAAVVALDWNSAARLTDASDKDSWRCRQVGQIIPPASADYV